MTKISNFLDRTFRRSKTAQAELDARLLELEQEVKLQKERCREARRQRELARKQRDEARQQREQARRQRREAQSELTRMQKRAGRGGSTRKDNYLNELQTALEQYHSTKAENPDLDNVSLAIREMAQGVEAPAYTKIFPQRRTPPQSVAFVTVANNLFIPGLEVLLASLLDVYPDFCSDVIVFHDNSISDFSKRRVQRIYPRVIFREPDMSWLTDIPDDSHNRKRIGILGYMSVMALTLPDYERVVVLDSDTAIIDDISMFWTGEDVPLGAAERPMAVEPETIFACHDHGARPWVAVSQATGKPIINSGILSVPRRYMSPGDVTEIKDLVLRNTETLCPLLDRFADQKAWNRFIYARDVQILPLNFNCNIKFLDKNRGGDTSFIRMVHFAGYKPWFDKSFMVGDMIPLSEGGAVRPVVWRDLNLQKLGRVRQQQYQAEIARPGYFDPVRPPREIDGKPACVLIGNGPSLKETDLSRFQGFETYVFNWFVHHEEFDALKPDNLVLGSHMFFGGWQTQTPAMPPEYIEALRSKSWRPRLWTSFYFREYFETWELADEFDIRYVLFEKPQKEFIDATGTSNLAVDGFTHDGRTGVLSVALPVALRQGYRHIGLVGCDSNYNQNTNADSNYFYDAAKHASLETNQNSLTQTWVDGGPGYFAYTRAQESLQRRGGSFVDYTINGALPLPKGDLNNL